MSLIKNLKQLKNYENELNLAKKSFVKVGLISDKVTGQIYDDGRSVLEVGLSHEFGTKTIPRRSFIRDPVKRESKNIDEFIKKQFMLVFELNKGSFNTLSDIGKYVRNIIVMWFRGQGGGTWEPLAEETIAKKGFSTILKETGTLQRSVTWKVYKKK